MKSLAISLLVVLSASAAVAHADGWTTYTAEKYGFSMLVPEGTKLAAREASDGWGALVAQHEHLRLAAVGKLGEAATPEEIQAFGVKFTGVSAAHWKLIGEGKDVRGWKWYRTVKAEHDGKVVFGGYGVGPKGNYLMLLTTTVEDFAKHEAEYMKWYQSITLS